MRLGQSQKKILELLKSEGLLTTSAIASRLTMPVHQARAALQRLWKKNLVMVAKPSPRRNAWYVPEMPPADREPLVQ